MISRGINGGIALFLSFGVLAMAASRVVQSKVSLAASSSKGSTLISSHSAEMRNIYSASFAAAAVLLVCAAFMISRNHRRDAAAL